MTIFPPEVTLKVRAAINPDVLLQRINYRTESIQKSQGPAGERLIHCFCPIHREQIFRTLTIEVNTGTYFCSNNVCPGRERNDLIDFYARTQQIARDEALIELAYRFGVELDPEVVTEHIRHAQEIGDNLALMGEFEEAEQQYERLLRLTPESVPTLVALYRVRDKLPDKQKLGAAAVQLAAALAADGRNDDVAAVLHDYLDRQPGDQDARLLYVESLQKIGRADDAMRESVEMATAMQARGQTDQALEIFRKVQQSGAGSAVSPQIVDILTASGRSSEAVEELIRRADSLHHMGLDMEAVEALHRALDLEPTRDDLRLRTAEYIAHGQLGGPVLAYFITILRGMIANQSHGPAAQALNTLRAAFPDNAGLYELKGDLDEVRGHAEAAMESRLHCADLFEQKQDYEAALGVLNRLLLARPEHTTLLSRRAALLMMLDRTEEAAEDYLQIIDHFAAAGEYEQAAVAYQAVVDLQPDNLYHLERQFDFYSRTGLEPIIRAKGRTLARAYHLRSDFAKAGRILDSILRISTSDEEILTLHAEVLEAQGRRHEAAQQFLAAARVLLEAEDYDQTRLRLEQSLRCMPEHMEARELHADVVLHGGSPAQAVQEYEELAQAFLRAHEPIEVIRVAQKIQEFQPEHLSTLQILIGAYDQLGMIDKKRALQMHLVQIYRRQQRYTIASGLCQSILNEDQNYAPALEQLVAISENTRQSDRSMDFLWELSRTHARVGRPAEERKTLEELLSRSPFHPQATSRILELLCTSSQPAEMRGGVNRIIERFLSAGRRDEIAALLDDMAGRFPSPDIYGALVRLYQMRGDQEKLKEALRAQAAALARSLRDAEAVEVWGQLARITPDDLSLREARIELLLRMDEKKRALEEYRSLAHAYKHRGELTRAETTLQQIIKLAPDDRRARESLISFHIDRGSEHEALSEIENLASLEIHHENFAAAISAYERVFEFNPRSEETFHKIIALKKRAGDVEGALKYYQGLLAVLAEDARPGAFELAAREAIGLAPKQWDIRMRLAEHLIASGRNIEGEGTLIETAGLQLRERDLEQAGRTIEKLLGFNRESVRGKTLHAELLALQGNHEGALSKFIELADHIGSSSMSVTGQPVPMPSYGNYEGLTRVKEYTFDQYVVGSRNNFAHASALAVSRAPGKNYNPLFLYADVGLGKTHLCHAVANYAIEHHPQLRVFYTMTEDFMEGLINAIQNNTVSQFRNRHRTTDILIIDDIQFLSGKERAQEEFFHIFNALFEGGKQIVITSDRPPKSIAHLENRLRSRFGAGVIVDIQSPDLETRIAILRRELIQRGRNQEVSDEAILALAESIPANIRDLKGALIQLLARHDATNQAIDSDLVHMIVDQFVDHV